MVERLPSRLLRLEGLAVLAGALVLYFHADYSWLLLLLLILAPDLSALGYGLKYPTGFKDTHLQRV